MADKLYELLLLIRENYTNYELRYDLVLRALLQARELGYQCGFRVDPDEPEWPVIAIVLPDIGEVSWHMPPSGIQYDGILNQNKIRTDLYRSYTNGNTSM